MTDRRGVRLARGLAAVAAVGGGGGGGAPATPADVLVGQATWRMLGWGSDVPLQYTSGNRATLLGQGWGGDINNVGYLRHFGGSDDYKGSTAAADADGGVYNEQRMVQGLHAAPFNQPYVANLHANSQLAGLSIYMQSADSGNIPPFGDWWDATKESNFAADLSNLGAFNGYIGMDILGGDFEPYNGKTWAASGYSGDTHTAAQNRAKCYEWFYNAFTAYLVGHPNPTLVFYSIYMPKGYYWQTLVDASFPAGILEGRMLHDALAGIIGAMRAANSSGRIVIADATYYRPNSDQSNKLNTQGPLAFLSTYLTQADWNWAAHHLDFVQFTWMGTDNTPYYNGSQPGEPAGSNMFAQARVWGMGSMRVDYEYDGGALSNAAFGTYAGSNNWTTPAGRVTGMQAAASQTAISTTAPALSVTSALASGGFVTISGIAGPTAYGTRCVDIRDSNLAYLGTAQMVWNQNGGTYGTNFDAATMSWSLTVPGVAGNYFVATEYSTKEDTHSAVKQAT